MEFIWPLMLFALLLVPVFVYVYLRMQQRRKQIVARYNNFGLTQGSKGRQVGARRHIPPAIYLLALIIFIIALARPQTTVSIPRIEGTIILAFDVSGSMAADDMKPTRMDAAKVAVQDFIERQPANVEIGVVSFSDSGFAVQPPTKERGEVLAAINRMSPQRGTSLASGIFASITTIEAALNPVPSMYTNLTPEPTTEPTPMPAGQHSSGVIVLLTDGENTSNPDPMEAAQIALDRGIRIYTVGIGSPQGANLEVEGFTVHTQLDEITLRTISEFTGGEYYNAQDEEDLRQIYDNLNPQLILKPEETEVTALFAGVGLFVLLIGGMMSMMWFGRLP